MMVLAEYSSSHSLSYDVGNIHFDLAQTQQHFKTNVQLTHARPTMSCIHLVYIYLYTCIYILFWENSLATQMNPIL